MAVLPVPLPDFTRGKARVQPGKDNKFHWALSSRRDIQCLRQATGHNGSLDLTDTHSRESAGISSHLARTLVSEGKVDRASADWHPNKHHFDRPPATLAGC